MLVVNILLIAFPVLYCMRFNFSCPIIFILRYHLHRQLMLPPVIIIAVIRGTIFFNVIVRLQWQLLLHLLLLFLPLLAVMRLAFMLLASLLQRELLLQNNTIYVIVKPALIKLGQLYVSICSRVKNGVPWQVWPVMMLFLLLL